MKSTLSIAALVAAVMFALPAGAQAGGHHHGWHKKHCAMFGWLHHHRGHKHVHARKHKKHARKAKAAK
jgi:hypothetical protein